MANAPLTLTIKVRIADAVRKIKQFGDSFRTANNEIKKTGQTAKTVSAGINSLGNNLKKAGSEMQSFKLHLNGLERMLRDTLAAFIVFKGQQFFRDTIRETNEFKSAILGLSAIAEHKGVDVAQALQAASKLAADGLMDVASASKALQNLLQRGFNLEESIAIIERLKDAAAFNRQAHLSMAEAVVSATEGLKNENSILVDNAGVTKNVSVMWKEYAEQLGKGVNNLTLAEKRQAEFNGIMQETAPMVGNAAKLAKEYQGQTAKLNQEVKNFQATIGTMLLPSLCTLVRWGNYLLNNVIKPIIWFVGRIFQAAAAAQYELSGFWQWLKSGAKGGLKRLKEIYREAHKLYDEMGVEWLKKLNENPFEDAMKGAKRLSKEEKELRKTINELKQAEQELSRLEQERQQVAKQVVQEEINAQKEAIRGLETRKRVTEQALDEAIRLEKQYANEVMRQQQTIADIQASTEDKIRQIRRRGMSEAELEADKQREYEEKLAKAREAYLTGQYEQADKLAKEAQNVAEGFKDQERAIRAVQEAGDMLVQIHETMKAEAQESWEEQKTKVGELKIQIEDLSDQIEKYRVKLADLNKQLDDMAQKRTVTEIDADIRKAKEKIEELKAKINAIRDKTVTVTVVEKHVEQHRFGGLAGIRQLARGGKIPGFGGGDRVRALLEPGEFVVRKEAVARYGVGLLSAINNLRFNLPGLPKISLSKVRMSQADKQPLYRRFEIKLGEAVLEGLAPQEMIDTFERQMRRMKLKMA